jgi:hypothetical protein
MFQAASYQPLTVQAQVRSHASLCGICDGQSGNGTFFSLLLLFYPYRYRSLNASSRLSVSHPHHEKGLDRVAMHAVTCLKSIALPTAVLTCHTGNSVPCFTLIKKKTVEHWCHFQNKAYKNIITFDKSVTVSTSMLNSHLFMEIRIS